MSSSENLGNLGDSDWGDLGENLGDSDWGDSAITGLIRDLIIVI